MSKSLVTKTVLILTITYMVSAAAAGPSLTLEDQAGGSGTVVIKSLTLDKPGFVVIHKDGGGKPGPVIGHSDVLAAGTHSDVKVTFDNTQAGDRVFPMLHYDDGNGKYEFPGPDGPVKADGKVLVGPVNWK